jgi:carbamoyl-phosphate synthase large subunit
MSMENKNILVTSAGRRVSLVKAFKKELKKYCPNGKLFVVDQDPELSAAAQVSDKYFKVCNVNNSEYIDDLISICIYNAIGLIIPTIDFELLKLSENINRFEEYNIQVVVSNPEWIDRFSSKIKTKKFFEDIGIPVFSVYTKQNYKFPLFIKPISGSSSKENYIINSEKDFTKNHFTNDELAFFEYIDPNQFDEYTCDLYFNKKGLLTCTISRIRISIRGGEISKGRTIKNNLKRIIESKFNYFEGLRGPITVQFFMNKQDESVIGIEVNPRFGGGFPLSYEAGGNYPKWIIEEYLFNKQLDYFDDWEENLLMLRYDKAIFIR